MKKDHPYYGPIQVSCRCGAAFETASTLRQDALRLEVCSKCHSFYTGVRNISHTTGRGGTFKQRYQGWKLEAHTSQKAAETSAH